MCEQYFNMQFWVEVLVTVMKGINKLLAHACK